MLDVLGNFGPQVLAFLLRDLRSINYFLLWLVIKHLSMIFVNWHAISFTVKIPEASGLMSVCLSMHLLFLMNWLVGLPV